MQFHAASSRVLPIEPCADVERLGQSDLSWLLADGDVPRLSIYLPMSPPKRGTRHNQLRLERAIREADACLADAGVAAKRRDRYLGRLESTARDLGRWRNADRGFVALTDGEQLRLRSSPVPWRQLVTVGWRFQVLPAVPLIQPPRTSLILTLSENRTRLTIVTRHFSEELPLGSEGALPTDGIGENGSLEMLPCLADLDDTLDAGEPDIARLRAASRSVERHLLACPNAALVIAGDRRLSDAYRRVARHETSAIVNGNFGLLSDPEIERLARERLGRLQEEDLNALSARYSSLLAGAAAAASDEEIARAAGEGRVAELLVRARDAPVIELPAAARTADALANEACIGTLRFGGNVHFVPRERFPETDRHLAAVYRS